MYFLFTKRIGSHPPASLYSILQCPLGLQLRGISQFFFRLSSSELAYVFLQLSLTLNLPMTLIRRMVLI